MSKRSNPRAGDEFGHQDHQQRQTGGRGSYAVHQHLPLPAGSAGALPVHDHAGLGKGKRQEGPNGIERDETIGHAAKENQQRAGEEDQPVDSGGIQQPPPAQGEEMGQEIILATARVSRGKSAKAVLAESDSTSRMDAMVT